MTSADLRNLCAASCVAFCAACAAPEAQRAAEAPKPAAPEPRASPALAPPPGPRSAPAPAAAPSKAEQLLAQGIQSYDDGERKLAAKQLQGALDLGLDSRRDQAKGHKYLAFIV